MNIQELNKEAKKCFKLGEMELAMKCYKRALQLCEIETVKIHNNLARLFLETKDYSSAFEHCEVSIGCCKDNPKVRDIILYRHNGHWLWAFANTILEIALAS